MKAIINITLFALIVLSFTACTKEDVPDEANVTFIFDHAVNEKAVVPGSPLDYLNDAANPYNVNMLKYIISRVVLIDQSDNEVEMNNFDLIDAFGSKQLNPVTLPNGTYKKMRFTLGVKEPENSSIDPIGNLVPGGDMYFGIGQGYIFFKHEGQFLDKDTVLQDLVYHFGRTGNYVDIEIPVGGLTVNGVAKTAYVVFNLNAVYKDPDIDFNEKNGKRFSGGEDADWIDNMKTNLASAFSFAGSYEVR